MIDRVWRSFQEQEQLTDTQLAQFKVYQQLLISWNNNMNLTTITEPSAIIAYHFCDSLALGHAMTLTTPRILADIGSGAGFPGVPLLIKYPHLYVYLIEVTKKKIKFLETVIAELGLTNSTIVPYDWLTYTRKSTTPIDIFCARASLRPEVLVPIFDRTSQYKDATLVYWASQHWQAPVSVQPYIRHLYHYAPGDRHRTLVVLARKGHL